MTPTVSLRALAQKRPRTNPKKPARSSFTQRLFQTGTLLGCWRAAQTRSRDTLTTARTLQSSRRRRRGSPPADKPLYPTSPAAQECWDSTGQFLTRGFQESRPPLCASMLTEGLLSSLTQGLRKRLNMQRKTNCRLSSVLLGEKNSPTLPTI